MRRNELLIAALACAVLAMAALTGMAQESAPTTNEQTKASTPGYDETGNEVEMTPGVPFTFIPNTNAMKQTQVSFDARLVKTDGEVVLLKGLYSTRNVICTLSNLVEDTGKVTYQELSHLKEAMCYYAEWLLRQ